MKQIFDNVSKKCSKITTQSYSTSFSFGIKALDKKLHDPIYGIYGFVRLADEIVDTFHDYDKLELFYKFREDTIEAINKKISLNPILNHFQEVVNYYKIDWNLINTFLNSMEMDLKDQVYDKEKYQEYILGSAEVVGLMCLKIFVNGEQGYSGTYNTNFNQQFAMYTGKSNLDTSRNFSGHIADLRVVKGTAVYTSEFTPPARLTAITNTSLLAFNTPYNRDMSTNKHTITYNGDVHNSPFSPFARTAGKSEDGGSFVLNNAAAGIAGNQ